MWGRAVKRLVWRGVTRKRRKQNFPSTPVILQEYRMNLATSVEQYSPLKVESIDDEWNGWHDVSHDYAMAMGQQLWR
jgi:hypothetical protein